MSLFKEVKKCPKCKKVNLTFGGGKVECNYCGWTKYEKQITKK